MENIWYTKLKDNRGVEPLLVSTVLRLWGEGKINEAIGFMVRADERVNGEGEAHDLALRPFGT